MSHRPSGRRGEKGNGMKIVTAQVIYRWLDPNNGEVRMATAAGGIYGAFEGRYKVVAPRQKRSGASRRTTRAGVKHRASRRAR